MSCWGRRPPSFPWSDNLSEPDEVCRAVAWTKGCDVGCPELLTFLRHGVCYVLRAPEGYPRAGDWVSGWGSGVLCRSIHLVQWYS